MFWSSSNFQNWRIRFKRENCQIFTRISSTYSRRGFRLLVSLLFEHQLNRTPLWKPVFLTGTGGSIGALLLKQQLANSLCIAATLWWMQRVTTKYRTCPSVSNLDPSQDGVDTKREWKQTSSSRLIYPHTWFGWWDFQPLRLFYDI